MSSNNTNAPSASEPPSPPPPNDPSRPQPTLLQGLQTLSAADMSSAGLLQKPCTRDSLLVGLGAGFAVGGSQFVLSAGRPGSRLAPGMASGAASPRAALLARQWGAMSWAVGAFVAGSACMHLFCRRKRQLERESLNAVREAVEKKREEKRAEMIERRGARAEAQAQKPTGSGGWFVR